MSLHIIQPPYIYMILYQLNEFPCNSDSTADSRHFAYVFIHTLCDGFCVLLLDITKYMCGGYKYREIISQPRSVCVWTVLLCVYSRNVWLYIVMCISRSKIEQSMSFNIETATYSVEYSAFVTVDVKSNTCFGLRFIIFSFGLLFFFWNVKAMTQEFQNNKFHWHSTEFHRAWFFLFEWPIQNIQDRKERIKILFEKN